MENLSNQLLPKKIEAWAPERLVAQLPAVINTTDTPNEGWEKDRVPTCTSRIL